MPRIITATVTFFSFYISVAKKISQLQKTFAEKLIKKSNKIIHVKFARTLHCINRTKNIFGFLST